MTGRHRVKISATLDPVLVDGVDAYLREHPEHDRSKVIDEALALWLAEQQRQAMIEQFQEDDRRPEEVAAWRRIRSETSRRTFSRER